MAARRSVGIIYGNVSSTGFDLAVSDEELKRLDYVEAEQDGQRVLGQVGEVVRRSSLSFDEAMALPRGVAAEAEDKLSGSVRIIGYQDAQGRIQTPRAPFRAGQPVFVAEQSLVSAVLGLQNAPDEGAYLGHVKGSRIPVTVSMDTLAQKHVSVLAKTGAGKSYTVGVLLEEFLKANVPLVILDPHGEYGSLRHANIDEAEIETMVRFKVRPKSFDRQVREWALDTNLNPEAERLVLEGLNLEGRDIVDLLGGKLSGGQVGVLYQAIKEVKEYLPAYTLRDIMDGVARNKSNAKWNVLNALEVLEATKVFDVRGTPVKELVAPGHCTIINLKGVSPDIQEIVVTRITNMLWEARKRGEIPAHILVVEEAHNFCPERNVATAVSGAIIRTVASEGRKFGMGLVIVSQRPAKIDKNVLSQCNTQIVLKVTNPNDLKAIVQSVEGITNETADEVQRLPVGVALVAGGGLTQPVFVDVRPRLTKHGGRSVSVLHQEEEEPEEPEEEHHSEPATGGASFSPPFAAPPGGFRTQPIAPSASPSSRAAEPAPLPSPPPLSPPDPVPRTPDKADEEPEWVPPSPASKAPEPDPFPMEAHWPRRSWSLTEAQEIHRVASRIGMVASEQDGEASIEQISGHEIRAGRAPDSRLALYLEIARNACHVDQPACIRCPERGRCQFQRTLQEQRKAPSLVRRLWRR
ncbi:MAG: helicase HerA domain-containing protein [Thermoplasmatota archaeon]